MSATDPASDNQGISLRQSALIAGFGLLVMVFAAPFAEFYVRPKIFVAGNIAETIQNIRANEMLYLLGIGCYLITAIFDVIVAWALYVLLAPTNKALSLLTAWFRLIYAAIYFVSILKLISVFNLLNSSDYLAAFGVDQLNAQIDLLLKSFRYEWSFGLVIFGIHLCFLGYLVFKARYIPKIMGLFLVIAGLGYMASELGSYLVPDVDLGFLFFTFFGELIFMLWLLIGGWWIKEPAARRLKDRC